MRRLASLFVLLAIALAAGETHSAGSWNTYVRPYRYTDLEPRGDSIWAATIEGGLIRFDRRTAKFASITREPGGLASNHLTALTFDRSGRLWVGTDGQGVSRLSADGSRWDLVNALDGVPNPVIRVLEAQGDTVWIGTAGGIALWNGREIAGALPDGVNPSPFANDNISGIVVRGDSLWVSTSQSVYWSRISTGLTTWTAVDSGLPSLNVEGLAADAVSMFAVSQGTAHRLNPATSRWEQRGGIGYVSRISDDGGVVLVSTQTGIYRWAGFSWTAVNSNLTVPPCVALDAPCPGVFAMTVDDSGHVIAANQTGLWREPTGAGLWAPIAPEGIGGNDIQNLALDGPRLYVATFIEGVSRFDGARFRNWPPTPCAGGAACDTTFRSSAYAFMLFVDLQGRKWVSNWGSAIESFDDSIDPPQFTHFQISDTLGTDKHTFGWSGTGDPGGGRWLGMDTNGLGDNFDPIGLEYYDPSGSYAANYLPRNTPTMDGSQIRALSVDSFNRLWVGYATKGVDVFSLPSSPGGPLSQVNEVDSSATSDVFGLVCHESKAWVFSTSDVRAFNTTDFRQVAKYKIAGAPAPRGACHPLDVGPDGTAWVGTVSGVRHYLEDGTFEDFTSDNSPLADNEVRAVRVDSDGVVWIGTAAGLNRFDPAYVSPPPPPLASLSVLVYPNPTRLTALGATIRLSGNATTYHGEIYDISGRLLQRFQSANGAAFWNGRDRHGRIVPPGLYLARIEAGGRTKTARIALLR